MNETEAHAAGATIRGLFPRATDEQIGALVHRAMPYPYDQLEAVCDDHAEDKFLDVGQIMTELRERCPGIAREQAILARRSVQQRETAAGRTAEQLAQERALQAETNAHWAKVDARIADLPDDELAALAQQVIDEMTPELQRLHRGKDPRRSRLVKGRIVELLGCRESLGVGS